MLINNKRCICYTVSHVVVYDWPVDEVYEGGPADDLQRNIYAREGGAAADIMIGAHVSIEIIILSRIVGKEGFR